MRLRTLLLTLLLPLLLLPLLARPGLDPARAQAVYQPGDLTGVQVADYGAKGDGTTDDTIALNAAIAAGKNVRLLPGKTYRVSGGLTLAAGQILYGNGATIEPIDQIHTTTTTTITSGVTASVTLASVTGLVVGSQIAFAQGAQSGLVIHTSLSSPRIVTGIAGSVVTVSPTIDCAFSGTTNVYTAFPVLTLGTRCRVVDLTVNGDRANVPWGRWETSEAIFLNGDRAEVDHCAILEFTGEGYYVGNSGNYDTVRDCYAYNLTGNGVHLFGTVHPTVTGCRIINTNLDTANGHANGCIILSNTIQDATIAGNYCQNGITGVGSIDSGGNSDITITGNTIRLCTTAGIGVTQGSANDYARRLLIQGNRIYNCGSSIATGGLALDTQGSATFSDAVQILGNLFVASGVTINTSATTPSPQAMIRSNTFRFCGVALNYSSGVLIDGNMFTCAIHLVGAQNSPLNAITVDDTTGILAGDSLVLDTGTNQETMTVATVTDQTHLALTGNTAHNHADGSIANRNSGGTWIVCTGTNVRCQIKGNFLDRIGDTTTDSIRVTGSLSFSRIVDNTILGGDYGVNFAGSGTSNLSVLGNVITLQNHGGIFVNTSATATSVLIANNTVNNDTTASTAWEGIISSCARVSILANTVTGVKGNGCIGVNASNVIVKGNTCVGSGTTPRSIYIISGTTSLVTNNAVTNGSGGTGIVDSGTTTVLRDNDQIQ